LAKAVTLTPEGTLETRLNELSRIILAETPLKDVLRDVIGLTCDVVPGCDHCGVSLTTENSRNVATTTVATDARTFSVDNSQYEIDEGPCLEALRTGNVVLVEDHATDSRFPRFKPNAVRANLRSSLSFPLKVKDRNIGALNLYSATPSAFDDRSREIGLRLADQASIALANAQTHEEALNAVEHLTTALDRRGAIEKAKGILMATRRIDEDEAFNILRKSSQFQNKKLFDVAQEMLEAHERSLTKQQTLQPKMFDGQASG
jgi:GAF domain-containing protein